MLCRACDPDAALLFLYLNVRGGKASLSKAAIELDMPESRVSRAFDALVMHKIASPEGSVPVKKPSLPDPSELLSLKEGDPSFSGLCSYYEQSSGRILTRHELLSLSSLYYELSLPADLICLMINYVLNEKTLNMRNLERVAYEWHDDGVFTYADGVRKLSGEREKSSRMRVLMRLFGLYDRSPSEKEREYFNKWFKMGISDEMIKLAYEKAVMRTSRVSFAYINGILENWNASGVSTPKKAETLDLSPGQKTSAEERVAAAFEKKRHDRELTAQKRLSDLNASYPEFSQNEKNIRLLSSRAARASGDARKKLLSERDGLISERRAFLQKLSLPDDWLSPGPDCPVCRDYGYVGSNMCDCFKKALAAAKTNGKGAI